MSAISDTKPKPVFIKPPKNHKIAITVTPAGLLIMLIFNPNRVLILASLPFIACCKSAFAVDSQRTI